MISLSTGVSTAQSGVVSLSTGLSTTNSSVSSLSTSTSTGISAAQNSVASVSTGLSTVSSSVSTLNADANGAGIKYFHANSTLGDSSAVGVNSVAIGPTATATGNSSVALGLAAVAANTGDVALGAGSTSTAVVATPSGVIRGTTYGYAGTNPSSTVSIGAPGAERTLTNVAAGRVSASSTDAVNGSQLYATDQAVGSIVAGAAGAFVSDNTANGATPSASGQNASAGGFGATASGNASLVIGNQATDNGNANATVLGQGASIASGLTGSNVALGQGSTVAAAPVGTASVVIGGYTYSGFAGATPVGTLSVGSPGAERTITNVAAGRVTALSTDAINGSQLYSVTAQVSQTASTVATALGGGSTATASGVTSPTYTVYGQTTTTVAQAIAAVQQASPVQYATTSGAAAGVTTPTNTVALVGSTASAPVTVTNVAAGTAPSDAVNVSQLSAAEVHYFSVNNGTTSNGGTTTTGSGTPTPTPTPGAPANFNNTGAVGAYSVAVGANAASTASGDVAVGYNTTATGTSGGSAVALGMGNTASGNGAVALGDPNVASGSGAIAVGNSNTAVGNGSVALGDPNVAIGTGAVALGANNTATGDGSVALGNISSAQGSGSVAIGNNAIANNAGDVALGSGSVTGAPAPISGVVLRGTTYGFAGATPTSVVSVGAPGAERQITNVAAGQLSATSTNAVNGSQLYATDQSVNAIGSTVSSIGTTVTTLATQVANGAGLVQQTGGAPGNGQITVGAQTGGSSVNFSGTSGARVLSGVASGVANTDAVNVGQLEAALGGATANSVQYDSASHNSVTLGGTGATSAVALNNVGAGAVTATSTQAVNGSQLYAANTNITNLSNGAAGPFQVYQSGAVTAPVASGLQSTAGGDGAIASGPASTAIGYRATASGVNSVAIGANSNDGGQSNVVSVGSPGNERRITNVAPGVNGTDAVNVNQLTAVEQNWQQSISQYVQRADAGVALSLAAAGLHYDSAPGTTSLAGAVSYYALHAGMSFGLNHTSADGRWRYNVSTTFVSPNSGADVGVVAGFSYTFGH
jgi:autotransporter adhesin